MHPACQPVPLLPGELEGGGIRVCLHLGEVLEEIRAWVSVCYRDWMLRPVLSEHVALPCRDVIRALEIMKNLDPRGGWSWQDDGHGELGCKC